MNLRALICGGLARTGYPRFLNISLFNVKYLTPMSKSDNLEISKFKLVPVTNITAGQYVVNLGPVLEIEKLKKHCNLIISRVDEKQVIKFDADTVLVVTS